MDRREFRKRRRRRAQILSYITAALLLAGLLSGVIFAVRSISGRASESGGIPTEAESQEETDLEKGQETLSERGDADGQTETALEESLTEEGEAQPSVMTEEELDASIEAMSLEEKVAGLFFITPEQLTGVETAVQAGESTREALQRFPVGGLVYFAQNIRSASQLKEMLENTASYSKYPLFLGVDEEGGRVARVADGLGLENVGPMAQIGASGDADAAYSAAAGIASYLQEYGFNLDFAPVADVLTDPDNTAIADRSFGSDPQIVSQMVAAAVQGFQKNGVSSCLKHFPGHGNTAGDSHDGRAETDRSLEEMQAAEFLPFAAGIEAGADMVMVGHISAPGLTDGDQLPASMNEKIITGILRDQLGYDGIVITDAMNMSAVTQYYTAEEAAVRALKAGADMILMPEDFTAAYEGVIAAVQNGTIDEKRIDDSLKRVFRVKYRR